jgi:hypothetical protein
MTEEAGWACRRVNGPRVFGLSPSLPQLLLRPAQNP